MIRAIRRSRTGQAHILARQRALGHSTPAPVGGWNARDSITAMNEDEAYILDNWFPEESWCRIRRGHTEHTPERVYLADEAGNTLTAENGDLLVFTHGIDGAVETLMAYNGITANKLFAAVNGEIQNVTTTGEPGAPDIQGLTNDRWQYTMFGNSAGNFLYIVNGEDAPRYYDGSTWTTPTITGAGLTESNLIHVNAFKQALFFIEKNTMSFWYFPVDTITGAIAEFDLGPVATRGGHLMAMGTWTRDGGDGLDDLAVWITSEGEAIVYQGTDPANANTWALVGVFNVGRPIGRRCFVKWGGDLVVVTEDGFVPLSQVLTRGREGATAISDQINFAVSDAIRSFKANFGWQPIQYPNGDMLIFNIPVVESLTSYQYVVNTHTGKWCRFTGLNAFCWEVFNGDIYFGGLNGVFQADTGESDNGENIASDAQTAFSYFRSRGMLKRLTMARPIMETEGTAYVALRANMDFATDLPTTDPSFVADQGSTWDVATWDEADWQSGRVLRREWQSVFGLGYAAALRLKMTTFGEVRWHSTDWLYEKAGIL